MLESWKDNICQIISLEKIYSVREQKPLESKEKQLFIKWSRYIRKRGTKGTRSIEWTNEKQTTSISYSISVVFQHSFPENGSFEGAFDRCPFFSQPLAELEPRRLHLFDTRAMPRLWHTASHCIWDSLCDVCSLCDMNKKYHAQPTEDSWIGCKVVCLDRTNNRPEGDQVYF